MANYVYLLAYVEVAYFLQINSTRIVQSTFILLENIGIFMFYADRR